MPIVGYYNGEFVTPDSGIVPLDERGHQFGDGVYEVIRCYNGRPFLLDWHLDRLWMSLQAIRIVPPFTKNECASLIERLIAESREPESSIYLQVTRGSAVRNHLFPEPTVKANVSATVRPVTPQTSKAPGTLLMMADERWANAWIKTINLLPNILAKQTAHDMGADEALLVRDGAMIESASSNLWFVRDNQLITAPADRYILNGITRRFVMQLANQLGIAVHESKLPVEELSAVDAIFITGTLTEVFPIQRVVTHPNLPYASLPAVKGSEPLAADMCQVAWEARDLSLVGRLQSAFADAIATFSK
ncbi:D-alanine aminotransferase [Alicyclobacillus hesperidum subsp. aegles]|uniref:aminotransferase class IV n=1 Tax=Alicyclobacillus hesperidum TaxID=89784 RepID=UPI0002E16E2B|nr:aminotransferase class IV [Alicyclobacillus hesperidum]GLG00066.1 D-alanine aminotransferase [Alicyclobacillus hesperidum subsp. aegles]